MFNMWLEMVIDQMPNKLPTPTPLALAVPLSRFKPRVGVARLFALDDITPHVKAKAQSRRQDSGHWLQTW